MQTRRLQIRLYAYWVDVWARMRHYIGFIRAIEHARLQTAVSLKKAFSYSQSPSILRLVHVSLKAYSYMQDYAHTPNFMCDLGLIYILGVCAFYWFSMVVCRSALYRPTRCLRKTVQNCFCQNFVKFPSILIILVGRWQNGWNYMPYTGWSKKKIAQW